MTDAAENQAQVNPLFIHGVQREELAYVWPMVQPLIAKWVPKTFGLYSEKSIADGLTTGKMQLWLCIDGNNIEMAVVTTIRTYETGLRVCEFFAIGGDNIRKWSKMITDEIGSWAETQEKCHRLHAPGRPGWERVLKRGEGWNKIAVVMEKELSPGEDENA